MQSSSEHNQDSPNDNEDCAQGARNEEGVPSSRWKLARFKKRLYMIVAVYTDTEDGKSEGDGDAT